MDPANYHIWLASCWYIDPLNNYYCASLSNDVCQTQNLDRRIFNTYFLTFLSILILALMRSLLPRTGMVSIENLKFSNSGLTWVPSYPQNFKPCQTGNLYQLPLHPMLDQICCQIFTVDMFFLPYVTCDLFSNTILNNTEKSAEVVTLTHQQTELKWYNEDQVLTTSFWLMHTISTCFKSACMIIPF